MVGGSKRASKRETRRLRVVNDKVNGLRARFSRLRFKYKDHLFANISTTNNTTWYVASSWGILLNARRTAVWTHAALPDLDCRAGPTPHTRSRPAPGTAMPITWSRAAFASGAASHANANTSLVQPHTRAAWYVYQYGDRNLFFVPVYPGRMHASESNNAVGPPGTLEEVTYSSPAATFRTCSVHANMIVTPAVCTSRRFLPLHFTWSWAVVSGSRSRSSRVTRVEVIEAVELRREHVARHRPRTPAHAALKGRARIPPKEDAEDDGSGADGHVGAKIGVLGIDAAPAVDIRIDPEQSKEYQLHAASQHREAYREPHSCEAQPLIKGRRKEDTEQGGIPWAATA